MIPLEQWRARGSTFRYNGHDVFYVVEGDGDVVVCIHGFPSASWDWSAIWPALTQRFKVIAPDMLGFGFSAKPARYAYSLRDQATLHEQLLANLGINRAHILAHDYGDSVAQELLARHEDRHAAGDTSLSIASCCFLNGGLFPEAHRPRPAQKLLAGPLGPIFGRLMSQGRFCANFSEIFGPDTKPSPDELRQFWSLIKHNNGRRVMHKLIDYMRERRQFRDRWVGALQTTRVPLRLINGPEDPVSGRHMVDVYRTIVPNADVVVLDRIGHYPQVEAPDAVLTAFLQHVERNTARVAKD